MSFFAPLTYAFRTFNTLANLYLAGQISWFMYTKVSEMQKKKMKSAELRKKFIALYRKENGKEPSRELVSVALRTYNAVEKPWSEQIKKLVGLSK
jgi:hypothetical protein